jgi:two-component system alkaline phosphatase synthesis response regulator PhoP
MEKKILFIEDERALHKSLKEILEIENIELVSAFDGEEGLKKVQEDRPDLILLDLILPKIHGFDVLKKIKENKELQNIPLVILTNLEDINEVEKALELGATTYLAKSSYTLMEIVKKIKEILNP